MPPEEAVAVEPVAPGIPNPPTEAIEPEQGSSIAIGPLEDKGSELEEEALAAEAPITEAPITEAPVTAAPVAEAPSSAPQTQPAAQAPGIPSEIRQRIVSLEAQVEADRYQRQQESDVATLRTFVDQLADQIAKEAAATFGITAEDALPFAQKIAGQQGQAAYREYLTDQSRTNQLNAAFAIGREVGVDPQLLINLPSVEAMREAATRARTQQGHDARIAALEAENAALKKARIPVQHMDKGTGGGRSNSREAIRERYINGEPITPQENAVLFPDR